MLGSVSDTTLYSPQSMEERQLTLARFPSCMMYNKQKTEYAGAPSDLADAEI